jgi:fructoselysine and glucoselysine-specific PTS system IIC component
MLQCILLGILAGVAALEECTFGASMMCRPLFTGPIVGLILGDVRSGIVMGATLEMMFMGSIMVGSATPPEVYSSSVLGIAVAIMGHSGVGTAVALALPVSVFLQMWRNFVYAIPASYGGKKIEQAIDNRNIKSAAKWHIFWLPAWMAIPSGLLVFLSTYFGSGPINAVIDMIPKFVTHGFDVAAGVLSAVGLALLIKMMANKSLMPYLFIGFIAVEYLKMDIIGVAIAALCVALLAVGNMHFDEAGDF